MNQQNTPPPAPSEASSPAPDGSVRFAAYDTTYLKFVGGVHDTKAKARQAAKDAGATKFEVREV